MAITYSQLGNLEADPDGQATVVVVWHVKALAIRFRLGIPQTMNNLRCLSAYRPLRPASMRLDRNRPEILPARAPASLLHPADHHLTFITGPGFSRV